MKTTTSSRGRNKPQVLLSGQINAAISTARKELDEAHERVMTMENIVAQLEGMRSSYEDIKPTSKPVSQPVKALRIDPTTPKPATPASALRTSYAFNLQRSEIETPESVKPRTTRPSNASAIEKMLATSGPLSPSEILDRLVANGKKVSRQVVSVTLSRLKSADRLFNKHAKWDLTPKRLKDFIL